MTTEIVIEALGIVSWALLGLLFHDLRGQLRENTKATQELFTDLKLLIHRFDDTEKDNVEIAKGMTSQSEHILLMRDTIYDLTNELIALWSLARSKGWHELPEVPNIRRKTKREFN
jgi:hypothetical protein